MEEDLNSSFQRQNDYSTGGRPQSSSSTQWNPNQNQSFEHNLWTPLQDDSVFGSAMGMTPENSFNQSLRTIDFLPYNLTPEVTDQTQLYYTSTELTPHQNNFFDSAVGMPPPENSYNQSQGTAGFFPCNLTSEVGGLHERQFSASPSLTHCTTYQNNLCDPTAIVMLRNSFQQPAWAAGLTPENSSVEMGGNYYNLNEFSMESTPQIPENVLTNRYPKAKTGHGRKWTVPEHKRFLIGLRIFGKGDWRNISRKVVYTKTPTQVASHAQKYFIRRELKPEERKRSSIHDITTENEDYNY